MICGIETVQCLTTKGLPSFGDAWFIPGFITDVLPEEAKIIALGFVQHISSAGELLGLLEYYSSANRMEEAEVAAAYFWQGYFTTPANTGFHVRDERGRRQQVDGSLLSPFYIVLSVRGIYARYFFGYITDETPAQWIFDTVYYYTAVAEESIRFINDWLDHEPNRHFDIYFIHLLFFKCLFLLTVGLWSFPILKRACILCWSCYLK